MIRFRSGSFSAAVWFPRTILCLHPDGNLNSDNSSIYHLDVDHSMATIDEFCYSHVSASFSRRFICCKGLVEKNWHAKCRRSVRLLWLPVKFPVKETILQRALIKHVTIHCIFFTQRFVCANRFHSNALKHGRFLETVTSILSACSLTNNNVHSERYHRA